MSWDIILQPLPYLAILTGLCMGLMGGGGSLLAIPIFIHVYHFNSKLAVMASLCVVAINSIFASVLNIKAKRIDWSAAASFIPGSLLGTYLGAQLGLVISENLQVQIFAAIVFFAAYKMFRANTASSIKLRGHHKIASCFFYSMLIGLITGVLGVGGGFLIVPALVILIGVEHTIAVGTSLLIMSFNSVMGFWVYQKSLNFHSHEQLIFLFSVFALLGVGLGYSIVKKIPLKTFRLVFAVGLVALGLWMLIQQQA